MKFERVVCCLSLLGIALLGAPNAMADSDVVPYSQAQGWYLGGQVGGANHDAGAGDIYPAGTLAGVDISDSQLLDIAWGGFLGYRINDNFAVEAGWLDLGEFGGDFSSGSFDSSRSVAIDGLRLRALGFYPLPLGEELGRMVELFVGLGLYVYQTDASESCSFPGDTNPNCGALLGGGAEPEPYRASSDSGNVLNISVGGQVNITPGVALRVSYEHFFELAGIDSDAVLAEFVFSYQGVKDMIGGSDD